MCLPINEWTTEDLERELAAMKAEEIEYDIDLSYGISAVETILKERAEAGTYATV